jgi:RNA polymerase sigma-70 factor (ECF subfamily)
LTRLFSPAPSLSIHLGGEGRNSIATGSNLSGHGRIIISMQTSAMPKDDETDDDAPLVGAAQAGNSEAFAALYQRHAGGLMPMLWRLAGGDRPLAEDWLQDAFVQAWRKLDQLRDGAAFGGWLRRLAANVALAERRRGRLATVDIEIETGAPEPPWPAADLDLERAIAALPDRARQVLVLFHLSDVSHAEIAEMLGIDVGTSKAQLHRARALIKEALQ